MPQPPRSSCLKTCGASGPPSTQCATSAARAGSPDFMSNVPSPIVTTPGATVPAIAGPVTVAAAPKPSLAPTLPSAAHVPEQPSEELMLPPPDTSNMCICQADPTAPPHTPESAIADSNTKNTGPTDDHVSDDAEDSSTSDDDGNDDGNDNDDGDDGVQLIESIAPRHLPADSSGHSTAHGALTLQDLHTRLDILEHCINRIKGAITKLQKELAEAHRFNQEQNNHLHKIDIHMEHIVDNYFDIVHV
ncbi:hypothetical protein V8E53_003211 [Lactarius tabidus]